MKLSDLSTSPFLASDDYKAGTIMPRVVIERIKFDDVPIPNSTKKQSKAVCYFKGATKGWVMNKTVAREIAKKTGADTSCIDRSFVGVSLQLVVVKDVRRPDGTKGNAFRLHDAWPPASAPVADPGVSASRGTPEEEEERRIADAERAAESAGEQ